MNQSSIDYHRAYYERNKERIKERTKLQSQIRRNKEPEQAMIVAARARAKRGGYPFTITKDDIIIPKLCPLLGIPMYSSLGKVTPNSPSLDKIVPSKGYVKDNILVISYRANAIKTDASLEELKLIVAGIEKFIKEIKCPSSNK
jgi:hypothetical protein